MSSDNTDARKALRDFYKLQAAAAQAGANAGAEGTPTPGPSEAVAASPSVGTSIGTSSPSIAQEVPEPDYAVIDDPSTNIDEWVKEKLESSNIVDLLKTHAELLKEQAAFASEERELVNDNYKKLIQAAETLNYLSAQGALAGLDDLSSSIDLIAEIVGAEPSKRPSDPKTWESFDSARQAYLEKYPTAS